MDNNSPFFGPMFGDALFDFDGSGSLDMFESAVRDSEIFTYWDEAEAMREAVNAEHPDFASDDLDFDFDYTGDYDELDEIDLELYEMEMEDAVEKTKNSAASTTTASISNTSAANTSKAPTNKANTAHKSNTSVSPKTNANNTVNKPANKPNTAKAPSNNANTQSAKKETDNRTDDEKIKDDYDKAIELLNENKTKFNKEISDSEKVRTKFFSSLLSTIVSFICIIVFFNWDKFYTVSGNSKLAKLETEVALAQHADEIEIMNTLAGVFIIITLILFFVTIVLCSNYLSSKDVNKLKNERDIHITIWSNMIKNIERQTPYVKFIGMTDAELHKAIDDKNSLYNPDKENKKYKTNQGIFVSIIVFAILFLTLGIILLVTQSSQILGVGLIISALVLLYFAPVAKSIANKHKNQITMDKEKCEKEKTELENELKRREKLQTQKA